MAAALLDDHPARGPVASSQQQPAAFSSRAVYQRQAQPTLPVRGLSELLHAIANCIFGPVAFVLA